MKKLIFMIGLVLTCTAHAKTNANNTAAIKQKIIEESIQNYSGNCPCPYHTARNGSRCGKRSAYLRAGGAAPLCYPEDVTDRMVKQYKAKA